MLFDYDDIKNTHAPEGRLFGFCKEEGLDYYYTLAGKAERRKTGNILIFIRGLRRKRKQKANLQERPCPRCLNEPKGLEL